jgi:hypothetical protein
VIILRFGKSGRLARIFQTAIQLAHPSARIYTSNRASEFVADADAIRHTTLDSLLYANPGEKFLWLDASIDHSSTENLIAHEAFKRQALSTLSSHQLLNSAIGVSSGITLIPVKRIQISATHMLEYRDQKLAQERQFASLACPIFLPNLFTLVGPITYASQSAAWAQILKARIVRAANTVLNEPQTRKAWTSEFHVFQTVLNFLTATAPMSSTGTLVSGAFTLADIAGDDRLPLPPLAYSIGSGAGWLNGDYLPPEMPSGSHSSIQDALLRSICP